MTETTNPYRLATTVVPSRYALELRPRVDEAEFDGRVAITLDVVESVDHISLNVVDLVLHDYVLTDSSGATHHPRVELDSEFERATFVFDSSLPLGPAELTINYLGVLNDKLVGFYLSQHVATDGTVHQMAVTQAAPTEARRMFPSWDEPACKATFDVTLIVPADQRAYANSPIANEEIQSDGWRRVVFTRTMKMSTYLVAFAVGAFEETPVIETLGVPVRVISPVGKGHLANLAHEVAVFSLNFFSDYFDIPYPGDKLDLVAVPDFAWGAMENVGCVLFRETALLVDPANSSLAEISRVAQVVAHEIAHMWFGDLVTMEWWEGIWLNEAFATFMEVLCTDAYRPDWNRWVDFATSRDAALQVDGLHSTRAIEYTVTSPAEALGMFDLLTYEKGGSVLRMLEQWLGATVFRDGIRLYLRRHSYANAVTGDLWRALEEISGQNVAEVMNTFILQGGHPLVTFAHGVVTQQPFAYGAATGASAIGKSWLVPVATRSLDGGETTTRVLDGTPCTVEGENLIINAGGSGVFRSRYERSDMLRVSQRLSDFTEIERTILVADAWASLFASQISWNDFLAVAHGLKDANEPAAWSNVNLAMYAAFRASPESYHETLREIVHELYQPQMDRLGFERRSGEGEMAAEMRASIIQVLGTLGRNQTVITEARRQFDANELSGDIAASLLAVVASSPRPKDFDTCLLRYRQAATPQEEIRYLSALASFDEADYVARVAGMCVGEIRTQNAGRVIAQVLTNRSHGHVAWEFLMDNWNEFLSVLPNLQHAGMVSGITTFYRDAVLAQSANNFLANHPVEGMQRTIDQYREKLSVGLRFAQSLQKEISK